MDAVPGWLLRDENYRPRGGRDAFLDRSLLAVLALLARARGQGGARIGRRGAEPLVKLLALGAVLLLVALTRSPVFLAAAGSGLLLALCLQEGEVIASVLKTASVAALSALLVLLPAAGWGRGPVAAIVAKVFLTAAWTRLLATTTGWADLSGACKRLGLPDLLLLVADIALRYLVLLGAFALAILQALKLRSVGRSSGRTGSMAAVAGTLYLASREMGEELYDAMACRGFTGEYRASGRLRLGLRESVLGAAVVLLAALFFLTRRG